MKLFSFPSKGKGGAVVKPSSTSSEMTMGSKAKLVCNDICILKKIGDHKFGSRVTRAPLPEVIMGLEYIFDFIQSQSNI